MTSHPYPSRCLAPGLLAALISFLVSAPVAVAQQPGNSPVKIFILAGQSNMQGHGEMEPVTTQGTLSYTVANDPGGDYQFVSDGAGGWASWDDVWIHYERASTTLLKGSLSAGYGAANTTIGPELGFGWFVGNYLPNQVLLVKCAWGGKSLAVDFRPPSSGGTTGFYYNEILRLVTDATTNLATHFPDYDGQGYEIAGFGWHQGWNDRVNQTYNDEYEVNMANFIRDIRIALGVPGLPFVIATTGMSGWAETHPRALSLMAAQLAVAQYPEFIGNVITVDTRDFWRDPSVSPSPGGGQAFHWNRNAATHLDIGLAMGGAMTSMVVAPSDYAAWRSLYPSADLSDPAADFDGDGRTNDEERIWGLDPTDSSSANPYVDPLDASGKLKYSRRDPAVSGLVYTVWTTTNLVDWVEDTVASASQAPGRPYPDNTQWVTVTLSAASLAEPSLFVQLRATETE